MKKRSFHSIPILLIVPAFIVCFFLFTDPTPSKAGWQHAADDDPRPGTGRSRGEHKHHRAHGRDRWSLATTSEDRRFLDISTEPVTLRPVGTAVSASGVCSALPDRVATVGPVISGRVSQVLVDLGDRVSAGRPMAKLVSVELGQAVSEYYKALAELELARVNHERYERLISRDIGARKDLLAAEADFKIAQAAHNAAEKTLHAFGFTEKDVEEISSTHTINAELLLRAPIGGEVVRRDARVGERVGEDSSLFTIMDLSRLHVTAQVFERDVAGLLIGQRTEVTVNALPGFTIEGTVEYIGQTIDPETRTFDLRTGISNSEGRLKAGMFATVKIFTGKEEPVPCIPAAAVVEENGAEFVFVPDGEKFSFVPVRTGSRDDRWVEVVEGVGDGDMVVVGGVYGLYSMLKQDSSEPVHTH